MAGAVQTGKQARGTMHDGGEAFDAFVRARLPHLLRFGRALTGNEHAASDLVQDALERALMRWSRITSDDPEGYVRRAMVNRSISVWRKFGREHPTDQLPADSYTDPERDDALLDALRMLPPRQRAVIALRYYDDLTEAQTAEILGCAIGTVKSQASAAMTRLRALLDESRQELS
jgi:RNA polymerase sigma-70 factor (sigma-E family)